ncbi:MAG: hypothetical protein DRQ61_12760 [Gammaproteobacteria bacterium]|nr:MAG: hypothetical protein DRQ56_10885 [Gammaproteobacteria bacterium]RLA18561.1 MAG: hypothetical protein DRQ61_12760 [Gammaproteobacteria bacterium]
MKTGAYFSVCRKYRYSLWRSWDDSKPYAMFIGLNPSTADEKADDPTIRRCINFSKEWGFGGLYMVNLFAFRATKPSDLMRAVEPVGSDNDKQIKTLASNAGIVVAAWGNDGTYLHRSKEITKMLPNLKCLKINKSGEPAHPLYQPKSARPKNR